MRDPFGREVRYLRASITDLCDLRCRYCMPAEGVAKGRHEDMSSEDEIIWAIEAAAGLGVRKVRITGGEPLGKPNVVSICRRAARVDGVEELCLTTNGTRLAEMAGALREAGVRRVNVSLDTLDPAKYAHMTRGGDLSRALAGLEAALVAGFERVKVNVVLIGGFNDDEMGALADMTRERDLDVRFIELMPMAGAERFGPGAYVSAVEALERLGELEPVGMDGVARMWRFRGARGRVGAIAPIGHAFCARCDRIRLTADGRVRPCLCSDAEISIKGLDRAAMVEALRAAISAKPHGHGMGPGRGSAATRSMDRIGG